MRARIADHLHARRAGDACCAAHVEGALVAAGRPADVVALAKIESEPKAIADPVQRRAVQHQRLRAAVKVCREAGHVVDATMTILAGAEAVRTDAAVTALLVENPDLAVRFAPEGVSQILRDPQMIEDHGPFLMHRMAEDARRGDAAATREGFRRFVAWYRRRTNASISGAASGRP